MLKERGDSGKLWFMVNDEWLKIILWSTSIEGGMYAAMKGE